MSKLDRSLSRYKAKTEMDPSTSLELDVWNRLGAQQSIFSFPILRRPAFRAAAMSLGFVIGVSGAGLSHVMAPVEQPMADLAVFAPDAPYLLSSWLGFEW